MYTTATIVLMQLFIATSLCSTVRMQPTRAQRSASPNAFLFSAELAFVVKPPSGPLAHKAGDQVELTCAAKGIPPPEVVWMRDGQLVVQDPSLLSAERPGSVPSPKPEVQSAVHYNKLSIPCAGASDAGKYSCVAVGGERNIVADTQLFVSDTSEPTSCNPTPVPSADNPSAPKIYTWTSGRFEMVGNEVLLRCRATGWPAPQISWVKTDDPQRALNDDSDNFQIQSNGDLLIKSTPDYDPTGNYMCVASNDFGEDTVEAFFYRTALEKLL